MLNFILQVRCIAIKIGFWLGLTLILAGLPKQLAAQRFFEVVHNGVRRSYLVRPPVYVAPTTGAKPSPGLWLLLAPTGKQPVDVLNNPKLTQLADSVGAYLLLPLQRKVNNAPLEWDDDTLAVDFISTLLAQVWQSFPVDRNKFHIIGSFGAAQTLQALACGGPTEVSASAIWLLHASAPAQRVPSQADCPVPVRFISDSLLARPRGEVLKYMFSSFKPTVLVGRPAIRYAKEDEDAKEEELREAALRRHKNAFSISLGVGGFITENSVKQVSDSVLVSFKGIKSMTTVRIGYFITDRAEVFARFRFTIPNKKQNVNVDYSGSTINVTGSGSGGSILTQGIGLNYLVKRGRLSVGLNVEGFTGTVLVKEGDISGTAANTNIEIDEIEASTEGARLGGVLTFRLGVATSLSFDTGYSMSRKFGRSVGLINAIQGYDFTFRFSYLMGHAKTYNSFYRNRKY